MLGGIEASGSKPMTAMTRRTVHRLSGSVLAVFVLVHLLQHLAVLAGAAPHLALMDMLRVVYRWPPVEALVLACVLIQLVSGATLAWSARAPGQRLARLSGLYLLLFLGIHTTAVLAGRHAGADTNIYFAAAGMHAWPAAAFFYPYYFLAVVAVAIHLGSALARRFPAAQRPRFVWRCAAAGTVFSVLIVVGMTRLAVPAAYLRPFT
jgi:succinate dehydrogenase/fumarate reductase cytochrome b subunit